LLLAVAKAILFEIEALAEGGVVEVEDGNELPSTESLGEG
jgi:hypothetical protein